MRLTQQRKKLIIEACDPAYVVDASHEVDRGFDLYDEDAVRDFIDDCFMSFSDVTLTDCADTSTAAGRLLKQRSHVWRNIDQEDAFAWVWQCAKLVATGDDTSWRP